MHTSNTGKNQKLHSLLQSLLQNDAIMEIHTKNLRELWEAKRDDYDAKALKLDVGGQIRYNDAFDDLEEEMPPGDEWTAAEFNELLIKAAKAWQEFAREMT